MKRREAGSEQGRPGQSEDRDEPFGNGRQNTSGQPRPNEIQPQKDKEESGGGDLFPDRRAKDRRFHHPRQETDQSGGDERTGRLDLFRPQITEGHFPRQGEIDDPIMKAGQTFDHVGRNDIDV